MDRPAAAAALLRGRSARRAERRGVPRPRRRGLVPAAFVVGHRANCDKSALQVSRDPPIQPLGVPPPHTAKPSKHSSKRSPASARCSSGRPSCAIDANLQEVLEDVCGAISELLGYRAVVVNVYRPAFDDMLTSAAVGSEESVRELVGKSSPRETWVPLLDERFERRGGLLRARAASSTGTGSESTATCRGSRRATEPDAWTAEDALFVPLRDPKGLLIGVISVDEPDTGRRPTDEELDALVAISRHAALALRIAQDTANDVQHQRMLEGILEVSARLAEAEDAGRDPPGGVRRHPRRARLRQGRDRAGARRATCRWCRRPSAAGTAEADAVNNGISLDDAGAAVHRRVRGGRLLPRPDRGGRGAARAPSDRLPLGAERPRAARVVAPLADRAAGRAAGPHAGG